MANFPDARDIARSVSIRSVLGTLGWRIRSRNRADCGLCRGNSKGTLGFTEKLWKCHRCAAGGDVFSLVRDVQGCGFSDALKFVADLAGIRLEDSSGSDFRRQLAERNRWREQLEAAAAKLENAERALGIQCRHQIQACDRVLYAPAPWKDVQWQRAQAAATLRDEHLLPEYTMLSFGRVAERVRYVLAKQDARVAMLSALRMAGGVPTEDGRWFEVLR